MDEYNDEDYEPDELDFDLDGESDGSSFWDRILLSKLDDEQYDSMIQNSLIVAFIGLVLLPISLIWLWGSGIFLYVVIAAIVLLLVGLGLFYVLLGQPSGEQMKELFSAWKRHSVDRVKSTIPGLKDKAEDKEEDDEEEDLDDAGLTIDLMTGEEGAEGLTTVDHHLESAFAEMQSEAAQAEAHFAERTDEEWLAEGIIPPKVAARIAMEAGARTKEMSEQIIELMDAREEAQKQRHTENCNLMEEVIGGLKMLNEQLGNLVNSWPEDHEPARLMTVVSGDNSYPVYQPQVEAPLIADGQVDESKPVSPSSQAEQELFAIDTSTISQAEVKPKVGDTVIVEQINRLMDLPIAGILQSREVDEVVLDILSGTNATYWRVRNLRASKTAYQDLRLTPEQAEDLVRRLDNKLKKVRAFDDPALRAGLILEGLGDPFYRLCVIKEVFPDGDGQPVEPNLDDFSRVAAATGLDEWLEMIQQGDIEQITERLEGSSDFLIDYHLLAPIAQKKLKQALMDDLIERQRNAVSILLEPGSGPDTK